MADDDFSAEENFIDDDDDVDAEFADNEFNDENFLEYEEANVAMTRSRSFQTLSEEEIQKESQHMIDEMKEFCNVPASASAALLRHYRWNRDKLIARFLENKDSLLQEVGLVHAEKVEEKSKDAGSSSSSSKTAAKKKAQKVFCEICFEETRISKTLALGCEHRFCLSCWKRYLETKIKEGPECLRTTCMTLKCKELVQDDVVKKIVGKTAYKKYAKFTLRSFVDDNQQIRWCPAPNCNNAVRCERKGRKEAVQCRCGFAFCFTCRDYEIGDHMPATCKQVEDWIKKSSDESENVNWMLANTKKCPQCRAPIEKNGGCMHMTCTKNSGGCGYEFCWLCRGPWTEHGSASGGYYACNKYDKSDAKQQDLKMQDAKTELEVYIFYYHRYESHRNARKIALQQLMEAEAKSLMLQERFDVRSADTKFITEATQQLLANRRVLEFSYIYGFYLDKTKSAEKNLFEYLQEELEKHTNHLSELYEMNLQKLTDYNTFYKWKEDVTNFTRVTKKFLDNFVQGVANGLTVDS